MNDISDKLLNDWIENKLSLNQSDFYAQKFINVGFDSLEMIEKHIIDSYIDYLNL